MKLNHEDLLSDIGNYKKLDLSKLSNEAFERKPYIDKLSLEDGRMRYRIEARLVPTILGNYPSKYRRRGVSLACPLCSASPPRTSSSITVREPAEENSSSPSPPTHSQSHLLSGACGAVSDLLEECDVEDDQSLVHFFRRVIARNLEIEGLDFY